MKINYTKAEWTNEGWPQFVWNIVLGPIFWVYKEAYSFFLIDLNS